jgi:hypothetical protein
MSNRGFYVFTIINSASVELKEEPKLFDLIRMKMHLENMCGLMGNMSATALACVTKDGMREKVSVLSIVMVFKKSLSEKNKQSLRAIAVKFCDDPSCEEIQYLIKMFKEYHNY